MDSQTPSTSELMNSVRNLNISRRGGIRTRGGRLPSINMRELTQVSSSSRKVIAPKIPMRRRIKTEVETSGRLVVKTEKPDFSTNSRGRGKGRQQKVYLQTEGSFLADGPAARIKRDPTYDDSFSVLRASRKAAKASSDKNIDLDAIKDIMESYVAGEEYENYNEGKPPFRLPLQKDKMIRKMKVESDEDEKLKIKKEIIEDDKTEIKKEMIEDDKIVIKKEIIEDFETGMKKELKSEKDFSSGNDNVIFKEEIESKKPSAENFLKVKDDGTVILLQLPTLFHALNIETTEKDKEIKGKDKMSPKETEPKAASRFVDNLEEGFIGKLKIMKSGRMKLKLGSVEFELLDGTPSETYQEVVSIQMQNKEGDITVLGKVENKLLLSPVINNLLSGNVKSNKTLIIDEE